MSVYNESDYQEILTASIRARVAVPFDCYILLRANQRIVHFIRRGEVFTDERHEKLRSFRFQKLHIRLADLDSYKDYLREFLNSQEGRALLEEFGAKGPVGSVAGIPNDVLAEFGDVIQIEAAGEADRQDQDQEPVSEYDGDEGGTVEPVETEANSSGAVFQEDEAAPSPAHAPVVTESEPSPAGDPAIQLIEFLQANVDDLGQKLPLTVPVPEEELDVVIASSSKIEEELTRISGLLERDLDDAPIVIRSVTAKIEDELLRIRGVARTEDDDKHRVLGAYADDIENMVQVLLESAAGAEAEPDEAATVISSVTERIQNDVLEIKSLYKVTGKDLVLDALSNMVEGVQQITGLQFNFGKQAADETARQYAGLVEQILVYCNNFAKLLAGQKDKAGIQKVLQPEFTAIHGKVKDLYNLCLRAAGEPLRADALGGDGSAEPAAGPAAQDDDQNNDVSGISIEGAVEAAMALTKATGELVGTGDSSIEGMEAEAADAEAAELTPAQAKALAEVVAQQNRVIAQLKAKLESAGDLITQMRDRWVKFQEKAGSKLDGNDSNTVKAINRYVEDIEKIHTGTGKSVSSLIQVTNRLNDRVGLSGTDLIKALSRVAKRADTLGGADADAGEDEQDESLGLELELPPEPGEDADIEQLRTENKVLRSQLGNAKSLIDSNEKKIFELTRHLTETNGYASSLEQEEESNRQEVKIAQEKADQADSKNERIMQTLGDAERIIRNLKAEVKTREEQVLSLNTRIQDFETTMKALELRAGPEDRDVAALARQVEELDLPDNAKDLIASQERRIARLNEELEAKRTEMKELRNENSKLTGKVQEINILKKQMSSRFEKLKQEREEAKKSMESRSRKVAMITNLLDEARKTVSRLTSVTEELRRDRMDYIAKTNQAMKDHKDALSRANTLGNQVQAELQRNEKLTNQAEVVKQKYRELTGQFNEFQRDYKMLEGENKRMKLELSKLNEARESHGDPAQMARRLALLEREHKEMSEKFASERQKALELTAALNQLRNAHNKAS